MTGASKKHSEMSSMPPYEDCGRSDGRLRRRFPRGSAFELYPAQTKILEGRTNLSERVFEALFKGVSTWFGLQNVEECFERAFWNVCAAFQNLRLGSINFIHNPPTGVCKAVTTSPFTSYLKMFGGHSSVLDGLWLWLPNEDFGRFDNRWNQDVRSTFQGREYSICAKKRCKVNRKSWFHLLFILPKSSFGEHKLLGNIKMQYSYPWTVLPGETHSERFVRPSKRRVWEG